MSIIGAMLFVVIGYAIIISIAILAVYVLILSIKALKIYINKNS